MIEYDDGTKIAVPVEELEVISPAAIEKEEQSDTTNNEGQDDKEDKKQ
jgi:DUF971 family protein